MLVLKWIAIGFAVSLLVGSIGSVLGPAGGVIGLLSWVVTAVWGYRRDKRRIVVSSLPTGPHSNGQTVKCPFCAADVPNSSPFCPNCEEPRTYLREHLEAESARTGTPYAELLVLARETALVEQEATRAHERRSRLVVFGATGALVILLAWLYIADHRVPSDGMQVKRGDEARVQEIMVGVMRGDMRPTLELREEFWSLIQGNPTDEELDEFRESLIGGATTYQNLFYEDALASLRAGTPVHSTDRSDYEAWMVRTGKVSQGFVDTQNQRMEAIARGEPIRRDDGLEITFDEATIRNAMSEIDSAMRRVGTLLTKP